jgi:hypothetical protein
MMSELLKDYVLSDGEIVLFSLSLDYQFISSSLNRQATIELKIRKRLSTTEWVPCQIQLQFQQIRQIKILEDFSSVSYSDIVLKQMLDNTWYLSLDPYGNTGELHEQDNFVVIADLLIVKEL